MDALRPQDPQANGLARFLAWMQTPRQDAPIYNFGGKSGDWAARYAQPPVGSTDAMPSVDPNVPMGQSLGTTPSVLPINQPNPVLEALTRGRL